MKSILPTMRLLAARLREPSTYAGLSAIAVVFGMSPAGADAVTQILAGGTGLLSILLAEKAK